MNDPAKNQTDDIDHYTVRFKNATMHRVNHADEFHSEYTYLSYKTDTNQQWGEQGVQVEITGDLARAMELESAEECEAVIKRLTKAYPDKNGNGDWQMIGVGVEVTDYNTLKYTPIVLPKTKQAAHAPGYG